MPVGEHCLRRRHLRLRRRARTRRRRDSKCIGSVDILVNNAGVTRDRMFHNIEADDFDAVIDANLRTAWETTQAVLVHMRQAAKAEIASARAASPTSARWCLRRQSPR